MGPEEIDRCVSSMQPTAPSQGEADDLRGPQLPLHGLRLLVVENNAIIGMDIVQELQTMGAVVVGPVMTEEEALKQVTSEPPEIALLDTKLNGQPILKLVRALEAARVAFMFVTARSEESLPETTTSVPVLEKPFSCDELRMATLALLQEGRTVEPGGGRTPPTTRCGIVDSP